MKKCIEIAGSLSKAMDLLHQWTIENGGPIGVICTDDIREECFEAERDAYRTISYAEKFLIQEGFLSPGNTITGELEGRN